MKVLVLNAGSSSLKFTLFDMTDKSVLCKGQVERIGSDHPNFIYKRADGYKFEGEISAKDHVGSLNEIAAKLVSEDGGVIKSLTEISACGHRVLLGGDKITKPIKVDESVKQIIRDYIPLGPLHNPANLAGIEACEAAMPGVPNVGVFDTEFHQTMPPEAYLYPIPYEFYEKYGIRKYGFHGTSHRFVTRASAEFLGKSAGDVSLITCHLGNGCSIAAVKEGKVIDTTMGLTPLEGLMMGTRSGDIDAAAALRMIEVGYTPAEVGTILNKKSGLLAIGGINSGDMRDMLAAAEKGEGRAELAVKMFVRRIVKYIGSYYVLLDGKIDALVFTGGIGEFSVPIREMVLQGVRSLGVNVCSKRNEECFGKAGVISSDDSTLKAIVMPTNEELMIAESAVEVLAQ
ncbi:MAG: acetate kinase [Lentisphaerae bacterium]|nr:acetate kinase [Lentisphaerota bacterium]